MSLEQYKDANRKELWEILQIQVERIAELEKERDIRGLEKMALGLKASIDFWHSNTASKMQGHIEYGILGKRPVDDPDAIPIEILERDMNAYLSQAEALKEQGE